MPAAKRSHEHAEETKDAKTAAKTSVLDELIADVEHAAESLAGHSKAVHLLEVAFIHALAGSKNPAVEALDAAKAEIAKFAALAEKDYALLIARVHALLGK